MTNKEILDLKAIPERLCVIGGGVIGLEMAAYFSAVGSQVDVIEMLGKIAGPTEDELSSILQKALEKKGVRFHLNAKVSAVTTEGVIYQQDHQEYLNKADKVLLSIGRRPFTAGLGLETIGVEMAKNGAILTNEKLQTNVEGVYAAGDVNGKSMLAHTAYREAEVAVHNMLNQPDQMFYECIPSVIYTTPEVATAGLTEKDAENKGIETVVLSLPITFSGRHVAESTDSDGLCKLIVNKKNNTLIGAHLVGSYASEIIVMLSSMMQLEVDIQTILKLVFPHPTVGEIIKDTLSQLY